MASAFFAATNDRQRFAAVRSQLLRAIQLIPSDQLPQAKRVQATQLANKATETTRGIAAPAVQQGAALQASGQRRAELMRRLTARTESVRASIELQKVLVPCLIAWRSATDRRLRDFLRVEDNLDDEECDRRLIPISAFCEAARALDACIVALMVLNTPYKHALLAAHDAFDDSQVPELAALDGLASSVRWGPPDGMPWLGNTLKGPYDKPEAISLDCGAPLSLDYELLGLVWGEGALKYAAGAVRNNMPGGDSNAFLQQTALDMIVKPLEKALCNVVNPGILGARGITDPTFQRGVGALLRAAEETAQLCGTRGQDTFPLLWDLLGRLQRSRGVQLDLSGAPRPPPPPPPPPAQPPSQPAASAAAAGREAPAAAAAAASLEALAVGERAAAQPPQPPQAGSGSEGEEEGEEEPGNGSAGAGQSSAAAGEGGGAGRRRRKRRAGGKKKKAAAAVAAAAAPAAPPPPASGDVGSLMSSLTSHQPDCCVCLDELGPASVRLLNCSVRGLEGPFHALCGACWAGLERPQCPMCCREDVEALSPAEFLQALARRPGP